jgi:hypothetical protein
MGFYTNLFFQKTFESILVYHQMSLRKSIFRVSLDVLIWYTVYKEKKEKKNERLQNARN